MKLKSLEVARGALALSAALTCGLLPLAAPAAERVTLLALTQDKAIVSVDGARRVLARGDVSPEGVRLVEANTQFAVIEVDGLRQTLQLSAVVAPTAGQSVEESGPATVTLWAGSEGFFRADGTINGYPVRFLVDTGASSIALSGDTARRVGLDLSAGEPGFAQTASGITPIVSVRLKSVSVGEITLRNVQAGVVPGSYPEIPLLGGSFLGHVDMVRRGDRLELIEKP